MDMGLLQILVLLQQPPVFDRRPDFPEYQPIRSVNVRIL